VLDDQEFEEIVHTALTHLYEHSFLLRHPFTRLLGSSSSAGYRANSLRRLLLDAIQDLKPPREMPADSPAGRHYQYLYLRYVEARPVAEVARCLAVTERQTRRRHHDALAALCQVLRERMRALGVATAQLSVPNAGERQWPATAGSPPVASSLLDLELERIHAVSRNGPLDIADVINGAMHTVASLASSRHVATSVLLPEERLLVDVDRVVLREALVESLFGVIRDDTTQQVHVTATCKDVTVHIEILATGSRTPAENEFDLQASMPFAEVGRLVRSQRGTMHVRVWDAELAIVIALPQARPKTILVVDDNPDMLQLYSRFLKGSGHQVTHAQSGDEALQLAGHVWPACIVLDVMMPARDGWEILQLLRTDPATREVPVLVCSVLQQSELARSLGADGFLPKPISQRPFLEAIERCCRARDNTISLERLDANEIETS
jgi:CheY-like chemotaxis protein